MAIFVIAEIGINHNGDLNLAKQMMDVARIAGCDAVKFQKRTVEKVYTKEQLDKPFDSPWGNTQRAYKMQREFHLEQYREIDSYSKYIGLPWFASAWDLDSQLFLREFHCQYNKVASGILNQDELLKMIASEKKYTFISTGMATPELLDHVVAIFKEYECPFELMHCVATYPMPEDCANLKRIETLRNRYQCKVGYSGHEAGLAISYAAAALGATSLERHITLDRSMFGTDQSASLEPSGLMQLVGAVRKIEKALGNGQLAMQECEKKEIMRLRRQQ